MTSIIKDSTASILEVYHVSERINNLRYSVFNIISVFVLRVK